MKTAIVSSICAVMFLCSCLNSPSQSPPQSSQIIKEWTGSAIKNTEPFTINHIPWVIQWQITPNSEYNCLLAITIYSTNNNLVGMFTSDVSKSHQTDTYYVYQTGTFYLNILPDNGDYTIKVLGVP
jgi:hypothetical protein